MPDLGYSTLTGTTYILLRNGQKRAVPEREVVAVIEGFLDDHDLTITKDDGTKVRYLAVPEEQPDTSQEATVGSNADEQFVLDIESEMVGHFYASTGYKILTPERRQIVRLCAQVAAKRVREANERADESSLRAIEALNPGIDMEDVKRLRAMRASDSQEADRG